MPLDLLGAFLCCHTTLAAAAPAADIELPTAQVERVVLPNGLILLLEEDHRVPLVAFAARIRGGANAEGARLGGGASHFIEHLLFKGTATRPVGAIDREVRSYGGDIGAFTGSDYTGVNLTVGKPYAGQAAALLADVLQHATFEQAEIDKERLVIHSEMQMRRDDPEQYLHEQFNATTQIFRFYGGGLTEETILQTVNGSKTLASYLIIGNNTVSPFAYVDFYDQTNGNFSIVKQTAFNKTNNQTFLIAYSDVPSPNLYVNITNAYLLSKDLANSNLIKLLYMCNNYTCLWNNNIATLQLVYVNPDTKIYRIVYNATSAG